MRLSWWCPFLSWALWVQTHGRPVVSTNPHAGLLRFQAGPCTRILSWTHFSDSCSSPASHTPSGPPGAPALGCYCHIWFSPHQTQRPFSNKYFYQFLYDPEMKCRDDTATLTHDPVNEECCLHFSKQRLLQPSSHHNWER